MKKLQIKKTVSIEVASALLRSIKQNCLDLFGDSEFTERFTALRDHVEDMFDKIDGYEVTDFFMTVEYSHEGKQRPKKSSK